MPGILKTVSRAILRGKKAPSYPDMVESAGAAQKLQKGMKRGRRRVVSPGNPISRMDDSARKAFARRNLK